MLLSQKCVGESDSREREEGTSPPRRYRRGAVASRLWDRGDAARRDRHGVRGRRGSRSGRRGAGDTCTALGVLQERGEGVAAGGRVHGEDHTGLTVALGVGLLAVDPDRGSLLVEMGTRLAINSLP